MQSFTKVYIDKILKILLKNFLARKAETCKKQYQQIFRIILINLWMRAFNKRQSPYPKDVLSKVWLKSLFKSAPFPSYRPIQVVGVQKNDIETCIHELASTSAFLIYFNNNLYKGCLICIPITKFELPFSQFLTFSLTWRYCIVYNQESYDSEV